jgi:hypothetical protein
LLSRPTTPHEIGVILKALTVRPAPMLIAGSSAVGLAMAPCRTRAKGAKRIVRIKRISAFLVSFTGFLL